MAWTRPQTFVPGAFLRTCDVCGIRYRNVDLRRGEDGFWRCIMYCLEQPAITRDKISAESQRRREAPPPPHGLPFSTNRTLSDERAILWLLCEVPVTDANWTGGFRLGLAPGETLAVSSGSYAAQTSSASATFSVAGESMRYLYNLIVEGKRPASWIALATAKLKQIADWLITTQFGFGVSSGATQASDGRWGAFARSDANLITADQAAAGLGMLYAYRIFQNQAYLTAAKACASYLRNVQSIGQYLTADFTSADSAGTIRLYTGGLAFGVANGSSLQSTHTFQADSLLVLEFWRELLTTAGDGPYGCTGTAGGIFTSSPSQNLSKSIADLRAFWSVGAYDNTVGKTFTGLSSTTPAQSFNAFPASKPGFSIVGSGSWEYDDFGSSTGTTVVGTTFAIALRSLFAYEGFSAQVSSVWLWLMSFTTNPTTQSAAGTLITDFLCASTNNASNPPAMPTGQGNLPQAGSFYDPTLALATSLIVRDSTNGFAPIKKNGTALYAWATAGYMAGIQSSQAMNALKTAKKRLTDGYLRLPVAFSDAANGPQQDSPMLRGSSGLAFQMRNPSTWSAASAAACGAVFRYQPQFFTGANPPYLQPGVAA